MRGASFTILVLELRRCRNSAIFLGWMSLAMRQITRQLPGEMTSSGVLARSAHARQVRNGVGT
jgi:hypothetical protein